MNCNNSWCINNDFIINIEYPDSVEYQCPRFSLLSRSWTIRPSAAGRVFLAKRTRSWWIPTRVRRAPLAGGRMRSWQVPSLVNETYMYIAWKNETFAIIEKYTLSLIHINTNTCTHRTYTSSAFLWIDQMLRLICYLW